MASRLFVLFWKLASFNFHTRWHGQEAASAADECEAKLKQICEHIRSAESKEAIEPMLPTRDAARKVSTHMFGIRTHIFWYKSHAMYYYVCVSLAPEGKSLFENWKLDLNASQQWVCSFKLTCL